MTDPWKGGWATSAMINESAMDESIGVVPSAKAGYVILPDTSATAMQEDRVPESLILWTRAFHCPSATLASSALIFSLTIAEGESCLSCSVGSTLFPL